MLKMITVSLIKFFGNLSGLIDFGVKFQNDLELLSNKRILVSSKNLPINILGLNGILDGVLYWFD